MPIYVPREIIHAAGMLPLGIVGGGDQLEVIHGDAYYQSYICRIPRSTIELGVSGRLDFVDGMLFPSICDVIRNLSGMWKMMFPHVYVRYFDVPQNYRGRYRRQLFYVNELAELRHDLAGLRGKPITDDELRHSIAVYNENRRLVRELYAFRAERPWQTPAAEVYLMVRAGLVLPVEEHTAHVARLSRPPRDAEERPRRDNCRIVLTGVFCEQPPLNLIKSLELVRLLRGRRRSPAGHPLAHRRRSRRGRSAAKSCARLPASFRVRPRPNTSRISAGKGPASGARGQAHRRRRRDLRRASFCDPALLDRPMLQHVLKDAGIPYIAFKYAENSGQMQPIREQAGTFADSIKLWSGT